MSYVTAFVLETAVFALRSSYLSTRRSASPASVLETNWGKRDIRGSLHCKSWVDFRQFPRWATPSVVEALVAPVFGPCRSKAYVSHAHAHYSLYESKRPQTSVSMWPFYVCATRYTDHMPLIPLLVPPQVIVGGVDVCGSSKLITT